jgi:type IV secretion system protein VirB5
MAVLCALTTCLATAGITWLSAHSRIAPFVVLLDSLGRPLASGIAEQATVNDDRLKRAGILAWVEDLRLITTDGIAQRKAIDHVYAQIASGSEAQTFISEFYRAGPPFKRAQTETVSVEVILFCPQATVHSKSIGSRPRAICTVQ